MGKMNKDEEILADLQKRQPIKYEEVLCRYDLRRVWKLMRLGQIVFNETTKEYSVRALSV
jgi:hypothetical protein